MANRSNRKRLFSVAEIGLQPGNATTGVWATQLSSNIYTLHKAAAATTSVLNIRVPTPSSGPDQEDAIPTVIKVYYQVTTADLTSAPTAALDKLSHNTTTGAVSRTAVTQAITFGGVDTVGKVSGAGAAGSHIAIITITTPTALADNEALILELTMNEAATSVLDISGVEVTYSS